MSTAIPYASVVVPWTRIAGARELLSGYLQPTRLCHSEALSRLTGAIVFLKLESELPTGSFKIRGALYSLSVNLAQRPIEEVITASTGNHGAAVAYAARELGLRATIFLPRRSNPIKRARIESLGATVVELGQDLTEALEHARDYVTRHRAFLLSDATDPDVPAGTATIACEIADQLPGVELTYVPVGDSALIRGVASGFRHLLPRVAIVGVQAQNAPSYYLSWKAGSVVSTETCDTIADGLATRIPVAANVSSIRALVESMCLVSEAQMLTAMKRLSDEGIIAEPAGAAGVAALLAGVANPRGKLAVVLVTGSNVASPVQ